MPSGGRHLPLAFGVTGYPEHGLHNDLLPARGEAPGLPEMSLWFLLVFSAKTPQLQEGIWTSLQEYEYRS